MKKPFSAGYDVEIDIWLFNNGFYLGHDYPQYEISYDWLFVRNKNLWIHCKNVDVLKFLLPSTLNCFWHEGDTVTLTNKGYIWANIGKQPIRDSIAVLPEINNEDISQCKGICSDVISNYANDKINNI